VIDPGALCEIARRLHTRRLISHEVFVRAAPYRAVFIRLKLQGLVLDEATLLADIKRRLRHYFDPLVGGPDAGGWSFGNPLRPTELSDRVREQLGEGTALTDLAIALDQPTAYENCRDVRIRSYELVHLAGFDAAIDRTPAMQGGLR
jgi:hypothetical protein